MEPPKPSLASIEAQIEEWLRDQPSGGNEDQIADMFHTVLKLAGDDAGRGDLKILNRTLKELGIRDSWDSCQSCQTGKIATPTDAATSRFGSLVLSRS